MFKIPLFPKAWVLSGPGTHRPLKRGWRRQAGQREDDVGAGWGGRSEDQTRLYSPGENSDCISGAVGVTAGFEAGGHGLG